MSPNGSFVPTEAQSMIAMCAIINGAVEGFPKGTQPPPQVTQPNPPGSWTCIYNQSCKTFGLLDNTWQLWQNGNEAQYAIVIQGTQRDVPSILEDLIFPMIRVEASAKLPFDAGHISLGMPVTEAGGAHAGFVYGAGVMLVDMIEQLAAQKPPANTEVFITGHSMGAAIATITTSLISQIANMKWIPTLLGIGKVSSWKTYVYAQPRPGNDAFANEMNLGFSNGGRFFRAVSTQDWVPQSPLTLEFFQDFNTPNPVDVVVEPWIAKHLPDVEKIIQELESKAEDVIQGIDDFFNKELGAELGKLVSQAETELDHKYPAFKTEINKTLGSIQASIDLVASLDFTGSGTPITLDAVPGTNPQYPNDFMWQHHAAQYYWLLSALYGLPTDPAHQADEREKAASVGALT